MTDFLGRAKLLEVFEFDSVEGILDRVEPFAGLLNPEMGEKLERAVKRITNHSFAVEFFDKEDEVNVIGFLSNGTMLIIHMDWQKYRTNPYRIAFINV